MKTLKVLMTQTRLKQPLVTLRSNVLGEDADLTPGEIRALSAALLAVADECEGRPMDRKHFSKVERSYALEPIRRD